MFFKCVKKLDIAGSHELKLGAVYALEVMTPREDEPRLKLATLRQEYPISWFVPFSFELQSIVAAPGLIDKVKTKGKGDKK